MNSRQAFFERVFQENKWGSHESRSGWGSELRVAKNLVDKLPGALRQLGVSRLLDLPCGDFNWLKEADLSGIDYIGGDIVPQLVETNTAAYVSPSRKFLVLDQVED